MEKLTCALFVQDSQIETQLLGCIQLFDSIKILRVFKNPIELIEKLHRENPDILFLNIDIEEIKSLDLLRIINRPPFILGITSDVSNISSLLDSGFSDVISSDFELDVFCKKISKIINIVNIIKFQEADTVAAEPVLTYKAISQGTEYKNFIFTKYKKTSTKIKYDDILYVRNTGNLLRVEDIYGNSLYHLSTLKKFLGQLPQDKFVRINKSIIVDFRKIDKFNNNFIFIKDESFKVSRVYLPKLKEMLKQPG